MIKSNPNRWQMQKQCERYGKARCSCKLTLAALTISSARHSAIVRWFLKDASRACLGMGKIVPMMHGREILHLWLTTTC